MPRLALPALLIAGLGLALLIAPMRAVTAATPKPAPEWDISEWLNISSLSLGALKGKVVVIDFFQLWCPGCNKFSGPLMQRWQKVFAEEIDGGKLQLVGIHTVFEGHAYQAPKQLRSYVKEKGITYPIGIDRHEAGGRLPETMKRYGTRGTPEMAIIDKQGRIRFQQFGFFEPKDGEALIRKLLEE